MARYFLNPTRPDKGCGAWEILVCMRFRGTGSGTYPHCLAGAVKVSASAGAQTHQFSKRRLAQIGTVSTCQL